MTDEPDDLTELYRNDPTATFDAHLFAAETVEDAGGGPGEKADRPVASLCSRTTAYGEFYEVAREGDKRLLELPGVDESETVAEAFDLCEVCSNRLDALYASWSVERADYDELREVAGNTPDVPGSGIGEDEMRERLLDSLGEDGLADALREVRA